MDTTGIKSALMVALLGDGWCPECLGMLDNKIICRPCRIDFTPTIRDIQREMKKIMNQDKKPKGKKKR